MGVDGRCCPQAWRDPAAGSLVDWRARRAVWSCAIMTGTDEAMLQQALGACPLPPEAAASAVALPDGVARAVRAPLACVADTAEPAAAAAAHRSHGRARFRNCQTLPITLLEAVASSFASSYGKPTAILIEVRVAPPPLPIRRLCPVVGPTASNVRAASVFLSVARTS